MPYLRAMIVDYRISEGFVVTVKPETDIRFLRKRTWDFIAIRKQFRLPVNVDVIRDHLPHLVVQGGKRKVRAPSCAERPTAA